MGSSCLCRVPAFPVLQGPPGPSAWEGPPKTQAHPWSGIGDHGARAACDAGAGPCRRQRSKVTAPHPHKGFIPSGHAHVQAKLLQLCPTFCDSMDCSPSVRLLCPWDSPGKNTGVGCYALFQGIFLEIFSDPGIEPTSLMSPALAGRFFTISTTWEAPSVPDILLNLETYALDYMPILRKFCPFNCITQCRIYRFWSTSKKQKTCVWHIISDVRYKV